MIQRDFNLWQMLQKLMTQAEYAGFAKGDRSDIHIFVYARRLIAVPANTIIFISV